MSKTFPKLFEPGRIGRLVVKNRIIKAPTQTRLAARDGSVIERLIRHYKDVARGGAGLIIIEHNFVDHKGSQATVSQLGIADNEYIPGLSLLARAIKNEGAKAGLQINHCGIQRRLGIPPIKAPSRIPWEALYRRVGVVPEELTIEEIQQLVSDFGDAAKRTQLAGFDMVEIHGAHGYLITNFLSLRTNRRSDWYGGSLENRTRFLVEVITDIRDKVGPDYPVSVRLSGSEYEPDGVIIEETVKVAQALETLGVNLIHVSGGNHHQQIYQTSPMSMPLGIHVWAAEAIKNAVQIPVVASGSLTTPALAEDILEKGKADFISLGRPLWADPYWPQKAKEDRPEDIRPCIRCNDGCLARSAAQFSAVSCTVNVAVGDEDTFKITPAERPKKVAVVGGGPAGMEAARVCALRGYEVTLYEKRKLGGVLIEASVPDFKADIRELIRYFVTQMEKLKIKVILEEANIDTLKNGGFDVVLVAIGGKLRQLDVLGIDKPHVTNVMEVLAEKAHLGKRVYVVGGGMIGAEVGLFLAEQGKEVVITTRADDFMFDVIAEDRTVYERRLAEQNVTISTGKRLERVIDKGAIVIDKYGNKEEILADTIVLNPGFTPQTTLVKQLKKEAKLETYAVGDCVNPRKIFDAIHEGHITAYLI